MRNLTPQLKSHMKGGVITLAGCVLITRRDGVQVGFTDHDQPLTIDGITYDPIAGFEQSTVQSGSDMAVDNLDINSSLIESKITQVDLLAGKYDFARSLVFSVNYEDPSGGKFIQQRGIFGEVSIGGDQFFTEIRGLTQGLSQNVCDVYSASCRANLGDGKCRVDISRFTIRSVVSSIPGESISARQSFTANSLNQQPGWFNGGYVRWLSGKNISSRMEVKEYARGNVELALPMPFAIKVGDRFEIVAGCDKSIGTCRIKFNNVINFRGEPDLTSVDRLRGSSISR